MAVLVIDAGNSRLKWARAEGAQLGPSRAAAHSRWSQADYARRLRRPRSPWTRSWCRASRDRRYAPRLPPWRAPRKSPSGSSRSPPGAPGITVGYREPWRLGVDRFAGLVGAHHLFAGIPVCVVGVGTAMTLDLVGRDGRHFGGAIIPSPALMVETLLHAHPWHPPPGAGRQRQAPRALRALHAGRDPGRHVLRRRRRDRPSRRRRHRARRGEAPRGAHRRRGACGAPAHPVALRAGAGPGAARTCGALAAAATAGVDLESPRAPVLLPAPLLKPRLWCVGGTRDAAPHGAGEPGVRTAGAPEARR